MQRLLLSLVLSIAVLSFIFEVDFSLERQLAKNDEQSRSNDDKACVTPELHGEWVEERPPNEMNMSYFVGNNALLPYPGCKGFVDQFQWKSAEIAPKFDAPAFCKILGNRTIAVIGDSTMRQTGKVLGSMASVGGCQDKVQYRMSDTLVFKNMGVLNRGCHWMEAVREIKPDIVILSAGAHIVNDANYTIMLDSVMAEMEEIKKEYPGIQIIWKTQSPAGGYPTNMKTPVGYPAPPKGFNSLIYPANSMIPGHPVDAGKARSSSPMFQEMGNHHLFWGRDNNILIPKLQKRGIPFLDMRMLYNRVDAHGWMKADPLHFCIPGPLRLIPLLLHRLLKKDFEVSKCIKMM